MNPSRPSVADKRRSFRQMHEAGCFAIPNPWDIGSARMLQGMGFAALASTSSGFAWSIGRPDNGISRDQALAHLAELVAATDVPLNADFESGFASDAKGVAESVRLAVETGVAGLSIEDSTGDATRPLFLVDEAVSRLKAARGAIAHLFKLGALSEGDSVIITSGDYMELHGATNTLRLLKVGPAGKAEGLGEL